MNRRHFLGTSVFGGISLLFFPNRSQESDWIPILKINAVNKNGRIYDKKITESICLQIKSLIERNLCFVVQPDLSGDVTYPVDLKYIAATVIDVQILDDYLYIKLKMLDTPHGREVSENIKNGQKVYVVTIGVGFIDQSGIIKKYEFSHFVFTNDSAWKGMLT